MNESYWTKTTRRRFLQGSGAGLTAAMLLAACGGNDKSKDEASSGLVSKATDTTKQAKAGGIYKLALPTDTPRGFEPFLRDLPIAEHNYRAYETLLSIKSVPLAPIDDSVFEGSLGTSWEFSPDKLQLIFKIRPEPKWDQRPPTNGRALDSSDVEYTWKRYAATATLRADLANAVSPDSPVVSVTTPDARTAVFNLAFPTPDVLTTLAAGPAAGTFNIMPKETESFDPRREQRGTGPWYLSEYVPSARFAYTKNPLSWRKEFFVGGWELPIVPEYAQRLAQFRVGNIYSFDIRPDDVVPTKHDVPDLNMVQTDADGLTTRVIWGFREGPRSPFRDERMRQAYSMAIDRDLFIDTFGNVTKYRSQGLPVDVVWNNAAAALNANTWWLNPQSKDFGPNAKYFEHNIAEAKKLIAAAGFPNGLDVDAAYIRTAEFGEDFPRRVEVALGMIADAGIRTKAQILDYTTELRPKYIDANGNFEGVAFRRAGGTGKAGLFGMYNSKGSQFNGFSPSGGTNFAGDPEYDTITAKIAKEFDIPTAKSLAFDLQRLEAKRQYTPLFPGGATGFSLAWPAVGNFGVYRGDFRRYWWLDDTKAPIKRA